MPWVEIAGWVGVLLLGWWLRQALVTMQASWVSRWTSLSLTMERDRAEWERSRVEQTTRLEQLHSDLADARSALTRLTDKQQADASLFVGAFLPDDQSAHEFEQQIKQTEDHAIAAAGPVRFSSRPSPTSARPSRRAPLIQRPKTSGNG